MSGQRVETVPQAMTRDSAQPRSRMGLLVGGGLALYSVVLIASGTAGKQIDALLDNADARSLDTVANVWEQHIENMRAHLVSQVRVLSEDVRVRSLVMVAKLDEGTLNDTLADLRTASGASCMAVLDASGKVKGVTGAVSLRGADLGTAPVFSQAAAGPASDVWTLPDRVLAVAVAPIKAAGRVAALLVIGLDLGDSALRIADKSFGGAGAVFAGERMIASRSGDPALIAALQSGRLGGPGVDSLIEVGGKGFRARAIRIGDSAAAARIVWMIPRSRGNNVSPYLKVIIWSPAVVVVLLLAFVALQRPRMA